MEAEPLVSLVDQLSIKNYCSWCFKAYNPKPKHLDERDPDSFVPFVTLKACGKCRYVQYCSDNCQRAHWSEHKPECDKHILPAMPTSLRFLLLVLRMKTDNARKN